MILHALLKRHDALLEEAENLATEIVNTPSLEDIASDVYEAVNKVVTYF